MLKKDLELVIATHNIAKINEYKSLFYNTPVILKTAIELGVSEPEENGKTFAENAYIKAENAANKTGILSLGEDSGLTIKALNGFPGVITGRWAKDIGGYKKAFKELAKKLDGLSKNASFQCTIVLICPKQGQIHEFSESVDGILDFSFINGEGFGYDPIFVPEGYNKTFAQLTMTTKNQISHRGKCCRKLLQFLTSLNKTKTRSVE
jgi:XTP/dITP diphosphohydrolase